MLVDFLQSGVDNVPLNRTLEFRFSSPIDPGSVNPDSIQVRPGNLFGTQVFGKYIIQGSDGLLRAAAARALRPLRRRVAARTSTTA